MQQVTVILSTQSGKNAILGWTIIFTINGYKQTLTHTKKKERKKRREGKRKTKEKKENC